MAKLTRETALRSVRAFFAGFPTDQAFSLDAGNQSISVESHDGQGKGRRRAGKDDAVKAVAEYMDEFPDKGAFAVFQDSANLVVSIPNAVPVLEPAPESDDGTDDAIDPIDDGEENDD